MEGKERTGTMAEAETPVAPEKPEPVRVYLHRLPTRIWHWVNAVTLLILLMSGLMIFNAHPRLYWGEYGANFDPAWLAIGSTADTGYLRIGDWKVETTGVLGRWTNAEGIEKDRKSDVKGKSGSVRVDHG